MILIESIKYYEVPANVWEIAHMQSPYQGIEVITKDGEEIISTNVILELVHGRRFVRPSDRKEICVGMSKDVQDILGMQYEAWENMELDRAELSRRERLLLNATLWTRLKWLFSGVKYNLKK